MVIAITRLLYKHPATDRLTPSRWPWKDLCKDRAAH